MTGSGNVAVTNGAIAPGGGLAVPPCAEALTPNGTAASRLSAVRGTTTNVARRSRQS